MGAKIFDKWRRSIGYDNKFASNCYASYFKEKALASGWSFGKSPTFEDTVPSRTELRELRSYLVQDMDEICPEEKA